MTAAQLAHLAELAALAADYFAVSNSDAARMFDALALRAETLSSKYDATKGGSHRKMKSQTELWGHAESDNQSRTDFCMVTRTFCVSSWSDDLHAKSGKPT